MAETKECCNQGSNLQVVHKQDGLEKRVCKKCSAKHIRMKAESGAMGAQPGPRGVSK